MYRLLRRHWRRGLASEGARELRHHGFEDLGSQRIFTETKEFNVGSRATMAAVGMRQIRTLPPRLRGATFGSELGEIRYAISGKEWLAVSAVILRPCSSSTYRARAPIGSQAGNTTGCSSRAASSSGGRNDFGAAISKMYSSNHESFMV